MADTEQVPQSCILFATADWDEPYWTNKQHCAQSLAELGTKVLYVESVGLRSPKAGSRKDLSRLWNRLCKGLRSHVLGAVEREPDVYVLSPLQVPAGHRYRLTRTLNRLLLKAAITRSARQLHFSKPLIWTYHPFMIDVIEGAEKQALIYHCVDDLASIPGVDFEAFRAAERDLLRDADIVFATAPSLAEHCEKFNSNTHYLSNVVDAEHFGRALEPGCIPDDLACIPEPRLCYHGVLSDFKVDFQLLLEVASLRPEWSWVLIGEEREGQKSALVAALRKLPNVHFLGYRPYGQLPEYLRGMHVGLLPSLINQYTRGMFPMKYYEYVAAGLSVVSTPLNFSRACLPELRVAKTSAEFVAEIECKLLHGRLTSMAAREAVGQNTWHARIRKMLHFLCDLPTSETRIRMGHDSHTTIAQEK